MSKFSEDEDEDVVAPSGVAASPRPVSKFAETDDEPTPPQQGPQVAPWLQGAADRYQQFLDESAQKQAAAAALDAPIAPVRELTEQFTDPRAFLRAPQELSIKLVNEVARPAQREGNATIANVATTAAHALTTPARSLSRMADAAEAVADFAQAKQRDVAAEVVRSAQRFGEDADFDVNDALVRMNDTLFAGPQRAPGAEYYEPNFAEGFIGPGLDATLAMIGLPPDTLDPDITGLDAAAAYGDKAFDLAYDIGPPLGAAARGGAKLGAYANVKLAGTRLGGLTKDVAVPESVLRIFKPAGVSPVEPPPTATTAPEFQGVRSQAVGAGLGTASIPHPSDVVAGRLASHGVVATPPSVGGGPGFASLGRLATKPGVRAALAGTSAALYKAGAPARALSKVWGDWQAPVYRGALEVPALKAGMEATVKWLGSTDQRFNAEVAKSIREYMAAIERNRQVAARLAQSMPANVSDELLERVFWRKKLADADPAMRPSIIDEVLAEPGLDPYDPIVDDLMKQHAPAFDAMSALGELMADAGIIDEAVRGVRDATYIKRHYAANALDHMRRTAATSGDWLSVRPSASMTKKRTLGIKEAAKKGVITDVRKVIVKTFKRAADDIEAVRMYQKLADMPDMATPRAPLVDEADELARAASGFDRAVQSLKSKGGKLDQLTVDDVKASLNERMAVLQSNYEEAQRIAAMTPEQKRVYRLRKRNREKLAADRMGELQRRAADHSDRLARVAKQLDDEAMAYRDVLRTERLRVASAIEDVPNRIRIAEQDARIRLSEVAKRITAEERDLLAQQARAVTAPTAATRAATKRIETRIRELADRRARLTAEYDAIPDAVRERARLERAQAWPKIRANIERLQKRVADARARRDAVLADADKIPDLVRRATRAQSDKLGEIERRAALEELDKIIADGESYVGAQPKDSAANAIQQQQAELAKQYVAVERYVARATAATGRTNMTLKELAQGVSRDVADARAAVKRFDESTPKPGFMRLEDALLESGVVKRPKDPSALADAQARAKTMARDRKRFGKLAGAHVRADQVPDILSLRQSPDGLGALVDAVSSLWKNLLVAGNPASVLPNAVGNSLDAHILGYSLERQVFMDRIAAAHMRANDGVLDAYRRAGLVISEDVANPEIRRVLDDVAFDRPDADWMDAAAQKVRGATSRVQQLPQARMQAFMDDNKRLAFAIDAHEIRGMPLEEAVSFANAAVTTHKQASRLAKKAGLVSWFVNYSLESAKKVALTAKRNPLRLMALGLVPYAAMETSMNSGSVDRDALMEALGSRTWRERAWTASPLPSLYEPLGAAALGAAALAGGGAFGALARKGGASWGGAAKAALTGATGAASLELLAGAPKTFVLPDMTPEGAAAGGAALGAAVAGLPGAAMLGALGAFSQYVRDDTGMPVSVKGARFLPGSAPISLVLDGGLNLPMLDLYVLAKGINPITGNPLSEGMMREVTTRLVPMARPMIEMYDALPEPSRQDMAGPIDWRRVLVQSSGLVERPMSPELRLLLQQLSDESKLNKSLMREERAYTQPDMQRAMDRAGVSFE